MVKERGIFFEAQDFMELDVGEKKQLRPLQISISVVHPIMFSNRCKAGYTTDSGIIKPHLQSFHVFSSHPKADINYLVSSDQVQVIGVSLNYGRDSP